MADEKRTVLFVYDSFTKQTEIVVEAMAQELTARGCTVTAAPLGFPDAQDGGYDLVVIGSPTWWLTTWMPVRSYLQSPAAKAVLDVKPFAAVSVPRRYHKGNLGDIKKLGEQAGGRSTGGTHFVSPGNQVMSMTSWLVFMRKNQPRSRYLSVPLPRPNLNADYATGAERHAGELAEHVFGLSSVGAAS